MTRRNWIFSIHWSCTQKRYPANGVASLITCNRKGMVSCNFEFCPKKKEYDEHKKK